MYEETVYVTRVDGGIEPFHAHARAMPDATQADT